MLGHNPFYFSLIRKYIIVFGTIFNDIKISRTVSESNTTVTQTLSVPIEFAPKEKMLARLTQDPSLDREAAIVLPRMAFELMNFSYDPDRQLPATVKKAAKYDSDPDKLSYQFTPVPYNFAISLSIIVKNTEDGTKIIEQILPFFTPAFTPTVNLIPEMDVEKDIPIVLVSTKVNDVFENERFDTRRAMVWELGFIMKGYLYGPIRQKKVIKFANTDFFFGNTSNASEMIGSIQVRPGLTANGEATTNVLASVNASLIEVDDDYGFIKLFSNSDTIVFE